MADPQQGKSQHQIDSEALDRYNRLRKESLEREARMMQRWEWRANKTPPMNIEPFPYERWRLSGSGMTDADRASRKLWLLDQKLAPNEPRNIPELTPRNPFRRAFAVPWDVLFKALKPVLGQRAAAYGRFAVPRVSMALVAFWGFVYHVQHNPQSWQSKSGWHVFETKDVILPGTPSFPSVPLREKDEFYDKGFRDRQVLQNAATSTQQ